MNIVPVHHHAIGSLGQSRGDSETGAAVLDVIEKSRIRLPAKLFGLGVQVVQDFLDARGEGREIFLGQLVGSVAGYPQPERHRRQGPLGICVYLSLSSQ